MWTYVQRTGTLFDPAGNRVEQGYSGNGSSKNNPDDQCVVDLGPIPRGSYTIGAPIDGEPVAFGRKIRPETVGKFALPLVPNADNNMCNPRRTGFFIHGDSSEHPGDASQGCIIMSHSTRQKIASSADAVLVVIGDALSDLIE
jgi:hypothetical protein